MGRSAPASVHDQPHRTHALTSVRTLFVCRSLVMVFDSVFSNSFVNSKDDCADHAIISDMVAFPVIDSRPSTHGSSGHPTTSVKLVPRKGVSESWADELNDLLAAKKLTSVSREHAAPTLGETAARLPGVAEHLVEAVYRALVSEWWNEATQLYHIVRGSIDISGVFEKKDLTMIKSSFLHGDYRDGPCLLRWATSFTNPSSVGEQTRLLGKVLNAKLPASANLDQLGTHMANLLIDWASIEGNSTSKPASFYFALLRSFPDVDGKLGHLRSWLSDQISDDDSSLADPSAFVERLMSRATTLGVAAGSGSGADAVNTLGGKLGSNGCKLCNSWLCTKGTSMKSCMCFNSKMPRPSKSNQGQWDFVQLCRLFVKAVPGTTSLKSTSTAQMRTAVETAGYRCPGDSTGGVSQQNSAKPPTGGANGSGAHVVSEDDTKTGDKPAPVVDGKAVTAICESLDEEISDPAAFSSFINSLSICNGSTINVLTRSGSGYEIPCALCDRIHPFEHICGPMVGLSRDPPGPDPAGSCFRSQCEFFCLCDRNKYLRDYELLRQEFQRWRDDYLRFKLALPQNEGWSSRVVNQPENTIFGMMSRPPQMSRSEEIAAAAQFRAELARRGTVVSNAIGNRERVVLTVGEVSTSTDHNTNMRFWNQPFWRIHDSLISGIGMIDGDHPLLPNGRRDHSVDYVNAAIASTLHIAGDPDVASSSASIATQQETCLVCDPAAAVASSADWYDGPRCRCTDCGYCEDTGCLLPALRDSFYCANCIFGCNCICDDPGPPGTPSSSSEPEGNDETCLPSNAGSLNDESLDDTGILDDLPDHLLNSNLITCVTQTTAPSEGNSPGPSGSDTVLPVQGGQTVFDFTQPFHSVTALAAYRANNLYDWVYGVVSTMVDSNGGNTDTAAVVMSKKPSAQEHAALGLVKQIQDQDKWKKKLAVYEKSPVVFAVGALVNCFNKRSWSEIILILISIRYVLPAHADQLRNAVGNMIQRLLTRIGTPVPPFIYKTVVRLVTGVGKFCFGLAKTIATGGSAITGDSSIGEEGASNLVWLIECSTTASESPRVASPPKFAMKDASASTEICVAPHANKFNATSDP